MTGKRARGLDGQRGGQRTNAEAWRVESAPIDTAPPERQGMTAESWGRTQEDARAMLRRQMCPVCGEGPWMSPLNHAAKKHGILRRDLREAVGMTTTEPVCDPEVSARCAELGRERMTPDLARDLVNIRDSRGGERRWTEAGRRQVASNLADWEAANPAAAYAVRVANAHNQNAHRKQAATLRRRHAERRTAESA